MSNMNKNIKETEIKVGLFVLACLLILFLSYGWLSDWYLSNRYTNVQVMFENIGNLEKGHSVYYRGVRVGRVSKMNIYPEGVLITLFIEKELVIDDNSAFYIKDKDMMGTKIVDIVPGKNLANRYRKDIYIGKNIPGLTDLISKFNDLSDYIETMIAKIENNSELFVQIDKILKGIDKSLDGVQDILKNINDSDLPGTFYELRKASMNITELTDGISEPLHDTLLQIDSLITSTVVFIGSLQEHIEKDSGNINKLLNDEELYDNLVESTKEVKFLLDDIKRNPRKYFKFSIF